MRHSGYRGARPGESLAEFIDRTLCGVEPPAWQGTLTLSDPYKFFPVGTVITVRQA